MVVGIVSCLLAIEYGNLSTLIALLVNSKSLRAFSWFLHSLKSTTKSSQKKIKVFFAEFHLLLILDITFPSALTLFFKNFYIFFDSRGWVNTRREQQQRFLVVFSVMVFGLGTMCDGFKHLKSMEGKINIMNRLRHMAKLALVSKIH